jgi:hypothetical protein
MFNVYFSKECLSSRSLRLNGFLPAQFPRLSTLRKRVNLTQSFRHTVMDQVHDSVLKNWWEHYYEPMDLRFQLEVTSSVLNKLSKFASSRVSRRILGQPRSTLNLSHIEQQGQILLISTAAGIVGSDISTLIGSLDQN